MPYTTPACYTKAPVRRETFLELAHRRHDQIPQVSEFPLIRKMEEVGAVTVNKDLVPGEAKFIKEVTV